MTILRYSSVLDGSTVHYPGHNCSVIFLSGCPLRCPWCYVPSLLDRSRSAHAEVPFFVNHYNRQGSADAVCITGGEPLDQGAAVAELCRALKIEGAKIKLETSGFYPDAFSKILPYVDYVAFDLKAPLDMDAYNKATGCKGNSLSLMMNVIRSLDVLRKSRGVFREIRTTVVPTINDDEKSIEAITAELGWADLYVLQQFRPDLELVDGLFQGLAAPSKESLLLLAKAARKTVGNVVVRTADDGDVPVVG